jgi:hypothetical protein
MNDESFTSGASAGGLEYPLTTLPEPGQVFEIVPGVHWLRMLWLETPSYRDLVGASNPLQSGQET